MAYYVYIVKCADNTLYTGYTRDVQKRVHTHNTSSAGAQYTKTRRPVLLVYSEELETLSLALKREYAVKKMSHQEKLRLSEMYKMKKRKK